MLLVALVSIGASSYVAARKVTLNRLEIGIDDKNGAIVSLSYPGVGEILTTEPEAAGLLDVAFPLANYVPMRLATRFSRAIIEENARGVTINWPELAPSRTHVSPPPGSVSARVTISAAPDGRSVLLHCRIENKFAQPLPQVLFPDLFGLRPLGTPESTRVTMARGAVTPFTQRGESRHRAAFWPVDMLNGATALRLRLAPAPLRCPIRAPCCTRAGSALAVCSVGPPGRNFPRRSVSAPRLHSCYAPGWHQPI
jgi:hypothetical protein